MESLKQTQDDKFSSTKLIVINVAGVRFETKKETLQKIPNSKLAKLCTKSDDYLSDRGEYFFDRDPQLFAAILNYHRIGQMHLPQEFCSISVRHELKFWEIDEDSLEQCCWLRYKEKIEKQKTLERLDQTAKIMYNTEVQDKTSKCCPCWERWRTRMWSFLDDPLSSKWAKVFAYLSAIFTILTLFTLCAETHPDFRHKLTMEHYAEIHDVSVDYLHYAWGYHGLYGHEYQETVGDVDDYDISSIDESMNNSHNNIHEGYPSDSIKKLPPGQFEQDDTLSAVSPVLWDIDFACHIFFALELLARLLFCPSKKYFFLNAFNMIDLLSILPFFIDMSINYINVKEKYKQSTVDIILILRVLRVIRIFRLVRHHRGLQILTFTMWASIREILLMMMFLGIGVIMFSCLIYYANVEVFKSIPDAFWWSLVTMTTVGYGDFVPNTRWGYLVGALCTISGVLVIAFTVPVIVSNFLLFYQYAELSAQRRGTLKNQCERKKKNNHIAVSPAGVDSTKVIELDSTEAY